MTDDDAYRAWMLEDLLADDETGELVPDDHPAMPRPSARQ
jgi:hypothetical protein